MRIFVLCKRYYTNKDLLLDRFGRLYHLPLELYRSGFAVRVDAIDYRKQLSITGQWEGVQFRSLPLSLGKLPRLYNSLVVASEHNKSDLVIASGDSHIGYAGMRIARRLNIPFVFDVYDYYPAFRGNLIPGMKAMFRAAATSAQLVLCASAPLMRRMAELNSSTLLVENGVEREVFHPMDMQLARQALHINRDVPVVGYFGSITPERGPILIEACRYLIRDFPGMRLLLAGKVKGVNISEAWIDYRGELSQMAVPEYIAACNVVAIPYADDPFNRMTGACKIAEYLACGKPVVATRIASHEAIFKDAPGGLCTPDPKDMADAIRRQLLQPQTIPCPESYSWSSIAGSLSIALQKLTQSA